MGQVSNTLLITDIVYGKGPGINTYGMPKGLALKMNKDEEAARKPCSEMCTCLRPLHNFLLLTRGYFTAGMGFIARARQRALMTPRSSTVLVSSRSGAVVACIEIS